MNGHLTTEELLSYLEGRAGDDARVVSHIEGGCGRCGGELDSWRQVLGLLRASNSFAPPAEVVQNALAIFDGFQPRPSAWQRLVANLTFDSRMQPGLAGARDVRSDSFQLLFEVEGLDIDMLCERTGEGWRISGQAVAAEAEGAAGIAELSGPETAAETEIEARGEFRLADVAPGTYDLVLRAGGREIVLGGIALDE
jgi:hypothetical protein